MKKVKKVLSVFMLFVFCVSCMTILSFASNEPDASATNIRVPAPSVGSTPATLSDISVSDSTIRVIGIQWLEAAPNDSMYHYMTYGDTFESGMKYRVLITFDMNPYTSASPLTHPITVNGNQPTDRRGFQLYYDFGTLSGASGVLGFFMDILSLPFTIIAAPFVLIASFFNAFFG